MEMIYVYYSRHWDRVLFDGIFPEQPVCLPSSYGRHWKGLRQLDACPTQQPDATYL